MYSRSFSDKPTHLPPHYGGTALTGHGGKDRETCDEEKQHKAPRHDEHEKKCDEPSSEKPHGHAGERHSAPERGFLSHLLPFDIKGDDLLLLGIALLLLNEGCEDEYLPLLLLFLLIIH